MATLGRRRQRRAGRGRDEIMIAARMPSALPSQARVVIVGGGIAGAATAYHLTRSACAMSSCSSRAS